MKTIFKEDTFVDFKGKSRQVIMCAASVDVDGVCINNLYTSNRKDYETTKNVRIGVAIQREGDIPNSELGRKIALGKALKDKTCLAILFSTSKGMINKKVVNALLEQEIEYFKQNPGNYISGYNKDKEKYLKSTNSDF